MAGTLIGCAYSVGQSALGLLAMYFQYWRHLLYVIYTPAVFFISYYWLVPESIKWLLASGKIMQVKDIINQMVVVNKQPMSEKFKKIIDEQNFEDDQIKEAAFSEFLKSTRLVLRVANLSFCWMVNSFVYFGLSIISVSIGGNKYTNFIYTSWIEIPGYIICYYMSMKIGRKYTLFLSLIVTGLSCSIAGLMTLPYLMNLMLFLIGKFAITISFTVIYVYASELFPTTMRHRLIGICSTLAVLGSMIAPQTPLLMIYMKSLPALLFGSTATISALLILFLPETLNVALPDTVQEAVDIGIKKKINK